MMCARTIRLVASTYRAGQACLHTFRTEHQSCGRFAKKEAECFSFGPMASMSRLSCNAQEQGKTSNMKNRNFYPAQYYRRAGILAPVKNVRMVSIRVQSRRHQRALWAKVNAMRQQTVSVETEGAFFAATIIEGARANAKRVKVWFRRDVVAMLPRDKSPLSLLGV